RWGTGTFGAATAKNQEEQVPMAHRSKPWEATVNRLVDGSNPSRGANNFKRRFKSEVQQGSIDSMAE
ncbi:MAG TPA: hypothetical protein VMT08_40490, partial [Bradyrhizobium sp.]|nr:hypothetical protein [Bradyrhizobium sp.]